MSLYQGHIKGIAPDCDPRHIEAYMRLERGTLDSLSKHDFDKLARDCAKAVRYDRAGAETLARSYGL
jgi:hypothetical protein